MIPYYSNLGSVVKTDDGSLTVMHPDHGECYHSQGGAEKEALGLYIEKSGIKDFWHSSGTSHVLDVGLGLGYNAISTITAWHDCLPEGEHFITSLEINPDLVSALVTGNAPWQENWSAAQKSFCQALSPAGNNYHAIFNHPKGRLTWEILIGPAQSVLPGNLLSITHVWQDPFSPEKNPDMWGESWFQTVSSMAAPSATLMTYSVAGKVRRALQQTGWDVERIPTTIPNKKQWLKATYRPTATPPL